MAEFEAAEEAAEDEGMALPTRQNDEFRPFVRRWELSLEFVIVKSLIFIFLGNTKKHFESNENILFSF